MTGNYCAPQQREGQQEQLLELLMNYLTIHGVSADTPVERLVDHLNTRVRLDNTKDLKGHADPSGEKGEPGEPGAHTCSTAPAEEPGKRVKWVRHVPQSDDLFPVLMQTEHGETIAEIHRLKSGKFEARLMTGFRIHEIGFHKSLSAAMQNAYDAYCLLEGGKEA